MAIAASTSMERDATPKHVVLIVEDEVIIRSLVAEHLRECGFSVIEAANAAEAITVLSTQTNIDLVFSDITMPGEIDGVGLAHWIRARRADIPVLLTSGAATAETAPIAPHAFVRKPYGLDDLEERFHAILADDARD